MNDDLILRARMDALGYSSEDIEKIGGARSKIPGSGLLNRIPFMGGEERVKTQAGMGSREYNKQVGALKTGKQQQKRNQMGAGVQETGAIQTMNQTAPGMNKPAGVGTQNPDGTDQTLGQLGASQMTPEAGGDGSVTGTPAIKDEVKTTQVNTMGEDGNVANTKTTVDETVNSNAETGGSGTTPATGMDATGATTPTTQEPQQATPQQGNAGGVNPQVQGMAQQFQAGQDMEAIQQGKGADKQSWLKNRSGMGKLMDVASFGLTSKLGGTGGAARGKANAASAQQTQNFQGANQRMNQRAMGMNAQMPVQTSFDSQLSAYSDIISIRKGIQERNTTHNLRR